MTAETGRRKGCVLLVDDNRDFVESTRAILEMIDYAVIVAEDVAGAKAALKKYKFTHLLLDLMLPDGSGLNVLEDLRESELAKLSVTIITGHPVVKSLVKSLAGPNISYLLKPLTFASLKGALEGQATVEEAEPETLQSHTQRVDESTLLIGESDVMQELKETIELVADTDANILLLGESGTGKEVIANLIHAKSKTSGKLVSANCGALNRELVTSELFGHEKGAFTGAVNRKIGVFEQAHNGTLFLDEVTEMPLDLQPNLLRALETQTVTRVGGTESIPAACRVVSATNRSAKQLVEDDVLREDLYFRLAVFPLEVPPLRDRHGDIPLLANHYLAQFCKDLGKSLILTDEVIAELEAYSWPGNVRELKHILHRAVIITRKTDTVLRLPPVWKSPFAEGAEHDKQPFTVGRSLVDIEKEVIAVTLDAFDGNKTKTAKVLGISTKTLYNKLQSYEDGEAASL